MSHSAQAQKRPSPPSNNSGSSSNNRNPMRFAPPPPLTPRYRSYTPSTPHAISAHQHQQQQQQLQQQRSGVRSTRRRQQQNKNQELKTTPATRVNLPRPDSARGILKRFAQITAAGTKRRRVLEEEEEEKEEETARSKAMGKEDSLLGYAGNRWEEEEDEDGEGGGGGGGVEKPRFSLPMDEDEEGDNGKDEGASLELGEAPTPSVLLGGELEYDPTATFQSVDYYAAAAAAAAATTKKRRREQPPSEVVVVAALGAESRRRRRPSSSSSSRRTPEGGEDENDDENDDDENNVTAELGRRAVSEAPLDRYPRSSFGSIRMSDFGMVAGPDRAALERKTTPRLGLDHHDDDDDEDIRSEIDEEIVVDYDGETEDLRRFGRSPSAGDAEGISFHDADVHDDEDTFRLHFTQKPGRESGPEPTALREESLDANNNDQETTGSDIESIADPTMTSRSLLQDSSLPQTRPPVQTEALPAATAPRRKKLKVTRHGTSVPALPASLLKRLAIDSVVKRGKRKPKINRDSLKALERAAEWFFEQVGEDLDAYSSHAGRKKTVDGSDVLALMRRQRVLPRGTGSLYQLASENLPPDVLRELQLDELHEGS